MVVIPAPEHVARVAADIDVFGLRADNEGVDREMSLQRSAMTLRFRHRHSFPRRHEPEVDPRRHLPAEHIGIAVEDQLSDDLLSQGRTEFRPRADDDVVVAEFIMYIRRGAVKLSRWP
jgi:hypothetical protein